MWTIAINIKRTEGIGYVSHMRGSASYLCGI